MNELMMVLRAIPRPARWLGTFFMFAALAFAVGRWLGLGNKSWIPVAVVFVICLALWLFETFRRRSEKRRSRQFEGNLGIQSRSSEVGKEEIRARLSELSEKWQQSVAQLRQSGMSIYSLPWYLLIGEPQSGKSTTLRNSGLEFPVGADALSGSGGTTNCDWWFSNEAVILDTAGRFTFQEESAPDQHEWDAFLKLLRRHRKYCPINGAIVVIPATSLVEDSAEEQEKKAKNIRQKLLHLQKVLEIRFPIFILITKADRILGFTEFFSKLDPSEQRQLFGWSNPGTPEEGWDIKGFPAVFDDIVERIHRYRVRFLKDDDDSSAVDKLFVFPEELEAIKEPFAQYLHTILAGSRYEEPFLFRGFYITSGVQQGRPIARACRDLLRVQMGDPQGVLEDLEQVFSRSRAFFIRDFYEKKLFPEQGLVARTRAALKKDRNYRYALYGLAGLLIAIIFPVLLLGAISLYNVVKPINDSVEAARECLKPDRPVPCEIGESYELIEEFEKHKETVSEAKWTLRAFLESSERNEISTELIPAIQAQLFRNNVLEPLLASFDNRARALTWNAQQQKGYVPFHGGLQELLRLRQLASPTARDDRAPLRAELRIAPLLEFCKATPKLDPQGAALDAWLQKNVDLKAADGIFQAAMQTAPDLRDLEVPDPAGAHQAFRNYWTVRNLALWDTQLAHHLRTYQTLYEQMLGLAAPPPLTPEAPVLPAGAVAAPAAYPAGAPPAAGVMQASISAGTAQAVTAQAAPDGSGTPGTPETGDMSGTAGTADVQSGANATLAQFASLAQQFAKNWAEGEAHMRTERQPPGATRPGRSASEWEQNCLQDYAALTRIYALTNDGDIRLYCNAIPSEWGRMAGGRGQFQHLFQRSDAGGKETIAWSADAARVKDPLVQLGALAAPAAIAADAQAISQTLDQQSGALASIEAIRRLYPEQGQRVFAPVSALAAAGSPTVSPLGVAGAPGAADPNAAGGLPAAGGIAPGMAPPPPGAPAPLPPVSQAFRLQQGLGRAREIAGLALAQRILPPVTRFFASDKAFGLGCANCFYLKHAQDHVPPANEFLEKSREVLAAAQGYAEVRSPLEQLQEAELAYLFEMVDRERGGGGGTTGGGAVTGGGGGPTLVVPARAGQAGSWRDFVREIRRWEPVVERSGGGSGFGGGPFSPPPGFSSGLTADALEAWVAQNQRLEPVLVRFREREQGRARAQEQAQARANRPQRRLSPDLVSAAETYKRCISGLEDEALKAWRQLAAEQDGASLADFHAFSGNLRLRGDATAGRLATVEAHGARLLAREIKPAFDNRLRSLWSLTGSCCGDRYPFLSRARLQSQQERYQQGPGAGGLWASPGRDTGRRTVTDALQLDTVSLDALDQLFFAGGSLDGLFSEFYLDPIIQGREKGVDFVGGNKERLRVLRQWQRFIYGDNRTTTSQKVTVKLLSTASTAPRIYVGERMGQLDLFGNNPVRPSTDASRTRPVTLTLMLEDRPTSVTGRNEDAAAGWSGVLNLRGGPLKIPYFVHLASDGRPRENGKVWVIRLQLPDYAQTQQRLEGLFELTFERPLPEIVPGAQIDGP